MITMPLSAITSLVSRQRMLPEDRERLIIQEATRYFAEYGLNGGTMELARRS